METVLGRLLHESEVVHHENRNRADNRRCNLRLTTLSDHANHHRDDPEWAGRAPLSERQVRQALRGRTTLEAATLLGVNHQTLRNRFDHLLCKRTSPLGPYDSDFVARLRRVAFDPSIGTREAARLLGVTQATMRSACRRHGIEWVSAPRGRPRRRESAGGGFRSP